MGPPFRRVLIANRGEIAVRLIRACHELGIEAVAMFSDADRSALHVRMAEQAVHIGRAAPVESYLHVEAILAAAHATSAEAIHPGYGFLAERPSFARAVEDAGLVFVGPPSAVIATLGDKLAARRLASDVGVPVVPGTLEPAAGGLGSTGMVLEMATAIGFPLLIKAAAGGGGRGMRRVADAAELPGALATAEAEARAAFGDGALYLERELPVARHVEVQLLGDADGEVVALGERDCSLQRRNQKLVEETPAPGLDSDRRRELHDAAVRLGQAAGLRNAATAEFLLTPDGGVHFLEVNARLQVEHGVTELVTGVDLVQEQLATAAGRPLSPAVRQAAAGALEPARHAIEVRLTAEDPGAGFAPTPGRIRHWSMPAGPGIRVDTAVEAGEIVPPEYDNLVAKVMVVAATRPAAIARLGRALGETEVAGIQTSLPFHRFVAASAAFRDPARLSTGWVAEHWDAAPGRRRAGRAGALAAAAWTMSGTIPERHTGPAATEARPVPAWIGLRREPGLVGSWRAAGRAEAAGTCLGRGSERWLSPGRPALPVGRGVSGPLEVRVLAGAGAPDTSVVVDVEPADAAAGPGWWRIDGELTEGVLRRRGGPRATLTGAVGRANVLILPGEQGPPGEQGALGDPGPEAGILGSVRGSSVLEVVIDGWRLEVEVEPAGRVALRERASRGRAASGSSLPAEVRAIIPGRVGAIVVGPGQAVAAGQPLLIVEAMKMQNEIRAPRAGTVRRVAVAAGQTVEAGAVLIEIE